MTPTDHIRTMFATFDAKDVSALAAFMTDDVRLRLGNAEPVQGKSAFIAATCTTPASTGRGHPSLLQRVSAPGRLGCGVPQLHRRHARVLPMRAVSGVPTLLTGPPEETLSRVVGIVLTDRLVEE
jgi:hypothetical protein